MGRQQNKPNKPAIVLKLGEFGLELIEYTGWLEMDYYIGAATGNIYDFGLVRQTGYVDSRDVESILGIIEDSKLVFRMAQ